MQTQFNDLFRIHGHDEYIDQQVEARTVSLEGIEQINLDGVVTLFCMSQQAPAIYVVGQRAIDFEVITIERDDEKLHIGIKSGNYTFDRHVSAPMQVVTGGVAQQFNGPVGQVVAGNLYINNGQVNPQSASPREILPLAIVLALPEIPTIQTRGSCCCYATGIGQSKLKVSLSGAGHLYASGLVKKLKVGVSGAGRVDARRLQADSVRLAVSGAGQIQAYARQKVKAHVSGMGKIAVYGNPEKKSQEVRGLGHIQFM